MQIEEQKLKGILGEHQKRTDAKIEGYKNEIKRHFDVVREDFDGKVQLIAEQYESIQKTLNSHTETLNSHTEMIVSMKEDIEIMKADTSFIKNGMKKKVDLEEFEILERRVAILEAKAR